MDVDFAGGEFAREVALDEIDEEHEFGFVGAFFNGDGVGEVGCYRVVGGGVGYTVVLGGVEDDGGGRGGHGWHTLWMMMAMW